MSGFRFNQIAGEPDLLPASAGFERSRIFTIIDHVAVDGVELGKRSWGVRIFVGPPVGLEVRWVVVVRPQAEAPQKEKKPQPEGDEGDRYQDHPEDPPQDGEILVIPQA